MKAVMFSRILFTVLFNFWLLEVGQAWPLQNQWRNNFTRPEQIHISYGGKSCSIFYITLFKTRFICIGLVINKKHGNLNPIKKCF